MNVSEFFEKIENRDEIIFLGSKGGDSYIFCGTADEWDEFCDTLNEFELEKLKRSEENQRKRWEAAKERLTNYTPIETRTIKEEYTSPLGNHCLLFKGIEHGSFWKREEFERFMDKKRGKTDGVKD